MYNWLRAFAQVIAGYFARLGPLRTLLVGGGVVVMVLAPGADSRTVYEGFGFVRTVVMPTLAPLFFTGLLLDALMCRIFMNEPDGPGAPVLRVGMRSALIVAGLLALAYAPFFLSLG